MRRTYEIGYCSDLDETDKLVKKEIEKDCILVEKIFKKAYRKIYKFFRGYFHDYNYLGNIPNNYYDTHLSVVVKITREDVDAVAAFFSPEDNTIVINKYSLPFVNRDEPNKIFNNFKCKKSLYRLIIHELIHFSFTDYKYAKNKENSPKIKVKSWRVGLCSREKMGGDVALKHMDMQWNKTEWLDEVLTELLTSIICKNKTIQIEYDDFVKDEDLPLFEKVKNKITRGPLTYEEIIWALHHGDSRIFLGKNSN